MLFGYLAPAYTLLGQERVVTFDIRETGKLSGEDYGYLLLAVFVGYALVRAFLWFIETRRLAIPWLILRRVVPLGTLLLMWVLWFSSALSETMLGVLLLLNLPAAVLASASAALPESVPLWGRVVIGSAGWWLGWYGAIRFAEWRAWTNVPVFLKIDSKE